MTKEKRKLSVVDDPTAENVYADTIVSTGFFNGTCVVTLGATRFIPPRTNEAPEEGATPSVYVTAKLAITPGAAVELVSILGNMFKTLSRSDASAHVAKEDAGKSGT